MKKPQFKYGCFSALEEDGHVKWLVTDQDGTFVGVQAKPASEQPARVKAQHWRADKAPTTSLNERFVPVQQVKQCSRELQKAIKRKMLKVHLPKGAKKNASPWVMAEGFDDARAKFGMAEAKAPTAAEKKAAAEQRAIARGKDPKKVKTAKPPKPSGKGDDE